MNSEEHSIKYNAYCINVVTEELDPVAEFVSAEGIEILTEYNNLNEVEETELKNPSGYSRGRSVTTKFSVCDPEAEPLPKVNYAFELLEAYPIAKYAFVNFGDFIENPTESNNIYGEFSSFRAEKGSNDFSILMANDKKELQPLTGKKDQYATNIIEILKDFKKQSPELTEAILGEMTEAQKGYIFNFSRNLRILCDKYLIYLLQTESGLKLEQTAENIKTVRIKKNIPNTYIDLTDKYSREISKLTEKEFKHDETRNMLVAYKPFKNTIKKKKKDPVNVNTSLTVFRNLNYFESDEIITIPLDNENLKIEKPTDAFRNRVYEAIITLVYNSMRLYPQKTYALGCEIKMTVNQIHKLMGYKKAPTKKQTALILESIRKLGDNIVFIENVEEEYRARGVNLKQARDIYGEVATYDGRAFRLIDADLITITPERARKDTKPQVGIVIKQIPPQLVMGKVTKQINSTPIEWLELKGFRESEQIKNLKYEIAKRISRAHYFKNNPYDKPENKTYNSKNYNTLVFNDLFKEAGIAINSRKTRYKYINKVEELMEAFKTQKGIISKYEIIYKGDVMHSIKFYV